MEEVLANNVAGVNGSSGAGESGIAAANMPTVEGGGGEHVGMGMKAVNG